MQGYLDKSLCSISNEMQCGEIYISQSPIVQSTPVPRAKCILKPAEPIEKPNKVTTTRIFKRNGKMFLKKDNSTNMVPFECIWTENNGERFEVHHFPFGLMAQFINRERRVTFHIEKI